MRLSAAKASAVLLGAAAIIAIVAAVLAGPGVVAFIRVHQDQWRAASDRHFLGAALIFVLAYGMAVTVMLPVAIVLTVASGVIFGAWAGAFLSIVGALTGALVAFLITRRMGPKLNAGKRSVDLGLVAGTKSMFAVVLTLRLTPLVPFTPVSVAAGAIRMPLLSFILATCLGVTPECAIYAAAGAGVAHFIGEAHTGAGS